MLRRYLPAWPYRLCHVWNTANQTLIHLPRCLSAGSRRVDNRPMPTKTHIPRLAWDAARAIVDASADPARAVSFADWFDTHAGRPYGRLVIESRDRLAAAFGFEATAVEAGVWRVRLDDLLHDRPDLVAPLAELIRDTADPRAGAA